jgi:hypothetical protein
MVSHYNPQSVVHCIDKLLRDLSMRPTKIESKTKSKQRRIVWQCDADFGRLLRIERIGFNTQVVLVDRERVPIFAKNFARGESEPLLASIVASTRADPSV